MCEKCGTVYLIAHPDSIRRISRNAGSRRVPGMYTLACPLPCGATRSFHKSEMKAYSVSELGLRAWIRQKEVTIASNLPSLIETSCECESRAGSAVYLNITNVTAKFVWKRVERFLTTLTKCSRFVLHPLKCFNALTPSSRRRSCRHHLHLLLCRSHRLALRLLRRLARGERGHRQLPADQNGRSWGILDGFCSCPTWHASYALATSGFA